MPEIQCVQLPNASGSPTASYANEASYCRCSNSTRASCCDCPERFSMVRIVCHYGTPTAFSPSPVQWPAGSIVNDPSTVGDICHHAPCGVAQHSQCPCLH
eukprot:778659-Amphidinium_carterae.1